MPQFTSNKLDIKDLELISILDRYSAEDILPTFPYTKKDYLKRGYTINFEGKTSDLVTELNSAHKGYFSEIIKRPKEERVTLYDPTDYMWEHYPEWLWHLSNIRADKVQLFLSCLLILQAR